MANIGAAIARFRAQKAAQEAVWAAAATEDAKQAAKVALANYDATTNALARIAADTAGIRTASVNNELVLDWSLLDRVETLIEQKFDGDVRWDMISRWALTDTPTGGKVLRNDIQVKETYKRQHVANYDIALRLQPESGFMLETTEKHPLYHTVTPGYESHVGAGTHAFASSMDGGGYDVTVPPGVLNIRLLYPAIAAIPGELPTEFRIWFVDERGEVVPGDFEVVGRSKVKVPYGPAGGTCVGAWPQWTKSEVVSLRTHVGTRFETFNVLAVAPHFRVADEVKCRIVPGRP